MPSVFSILAKRLPGKSDSKMTCLLLSGSLNLESVTQRGLWWSQCCKNGPLHFYIPLPSKRQHQCNGDCLKVERDDFQNCSVLSDSCAQWYAHTWAVECWFNFRFVMFFGRPYYRSCLWYTVSSFCLSVVCLSVTFCIVAKGYVLAKNCLKEWIGNQGQKVDFLGRHHISTSGFAVTATETAVFALFLPV